jgi:hypothetical protein
MDYLDSEWDEMIAWCPTQLSKKVYIKGIEFILYLRWRWDDPFTYNIYIDDHPNQDKLEKILNIGILNNDLFEKYNRWYLQENFDNLKIKLDAEYIWYFIEKPRIKKILIENEELLI